MRHQVLRAILLLAVTGAGALHCGRPAEMICNGSAANCDRRYDQVTFATTHDAFSYADGGPVVYQVPNQDHPIPAQLAYGIRGFGIRPAPYFGSDATQANVVYVSHNTALEGGLGEEPLLDILTEIRVFLQTHSSEVVALFSEPSVSQQQVTEVFTQAGLLPFMYVYDSAQGWPTLREMATRGQRLLYFTDDTDPARPAWQLPMWNILVDTNYNITDKSQFTCDYYRGMASNSLYFLNQFIYRDYGLGILTPDPGEAQLANDPDFVYQRARGCWEQMNRVPVYVYVDWYGQGDVMEAVNRLNALPR
jgi:hypothetical protein